MNKCIICFGPHENTFTDGSPNMYCVPCEKVRKAARGTVSGITDRIFLGDMIAGETFEGSRLCVHEDGVKYSGPAYVLPILIRKPNSKLDRSGAIASTLALEAGSTMINFCHGNKIPLLVHCHGGVERSPLLIAYYLVNHWGMPGYEAAYQYIKSIRPVVSDRRMWLPQCGKMRQFKLGI